jgi:hypothetical protein
MEVHVCHPSYTGSMNRRIQVQASQPVHKHRTFLKITRGKMAGDTDEVVEHLPNKFKSLSSNASTVAKTKVQKP